MTSWPGTKLMFMSTVGDSSGCVLLVNGWLQLVYVPTCVDIVTESAYTNNNGCDGEQDSSMACDPALLHSFKHLLPPSSPPSPSHPLPFTSTLPSHPLSPHIPSPLTSTLSSHPLSPHIPFPLTPSHRLRTRYAGATHKMNTGMIFVRAMLVLCAGRMGACHSTLVVRYLIFVGSHWPGSSVTSL